MILAQKYQHTNQYWNRLHLYRLSLRLPRWLHWVRYQDCSCKRPSNHFRLLQQQLNHHWSFPGCIGSQGQISHPQCLCWLPLGQHQHGCRWPTDRQLLHRSEIRQLCNQKLSPEWLSLPSQHHNCCQPQFRSREYRDHCSLRCFPVSCEKRLHQFFQQNLSENYWYRNLQRRPLPPCRFFYSRNYYLEDELVGCSDQAPTKVGWPEHQRDNGSAAVQ